ncbi:MULTISPECIES: preprotein translocase subunit SecG [unclassified Marinobacter]|uniref:preprotein translocase subunit SecG n=1 Tax=unclassified Marinobacter TaxID=83889 RepID=UPI0026E1639F|nr:MULTISPECIES: preprotein translocase subunit SecG [unclassified Marinobacter]MDO6443213.1 preprotein translocase subunit SecG [Marinobacter sp. 2_MG-2023]MDO6822567.1 preprotein translocase subunit SecG [Marinobacter sp. 1_MG-2023]
MDLMETLVVVVHVVIAVALVGLVLIQQGKGADAGAAFGGGGASQTVFGSQGSGSFLTRMTTLLAIVFFVTSFSLAVFAKQRAEVSGEAGIPVVQESHDAPAESAADAAESETGSGESGLPELE